MQINHVKIKTRKPSVNLFSSLLSQHVVDLFLQPVLVVWTVCAISFLESAKQKKEA